MSGMHTLLMRAVMREMGGAEPEFISRMGRGNH